ncbi:MutS domain III family protein [Trichomonas vaginalis G3]|uniref:MutS domain III family protein n=1 Tax=Trichomonas vaginalis (strain ATCC PRA-98 / G3) TaxID=412133 RepID=A2G2N4_TRIV3|nr:meiosis-specific crossover protein Msh5 (MutS-like protein) [Trichomonas vaginalis G3]EAX88576.1 MutS domain III family protein [Trichomonas vaginalis G3]KAI5541300.1 meiosis-specific crossover protein Msh5 (MutS-like protein) [Trichomonas vaginalis G3]|eukprot:XP_001301506.1 MutS domain III family protein [Trichomonas vaginalis G3]
MEGEVQSQDILAISFKSQSYGFVFYTTRDGSVSISESNSANFGMNFEKIIHRYNPSIICMQPNIDNAIATIIKDVKDTEIQVLEQNDFNYQNGIDSMAQILFTVPSDEQDSVRQSVLSGIVNLQSKPIVAAIGALVNFTNKKYQSPPIVSVFSMMEISNGLVLSSKAMSDLQIIKQELHPSIHQMTSIKEGVSLFTLLNRCSTKMGKDRLKDLFTNIPNDINQINQRHDILEEFTKPEFHPMVNELVNKMKNVTDVTNIIQNVKKGTMKTKLWSSLAKSLSAAANFCKFTLQNTLPENLTRHFSITDKLVNLLESLSQQIEMTIDFSKVAEVYINDDYDQELTRLRKIYKNLDNLLNEKAVELIDDLPLKSPILSLSVVYLPQIGFLTMCQKEGLKREDLPNGYLLSFETDSHFYCKNEMMNELDRNYGDIYGDLQKRTIKIIVKLSNRILSHSHELSELYKFIGEVDLYCSLAVVSVEGHWIRPTFSDKNEMKIVGGRHPLLEKLTPTDFIPNTIEFGSDKPKIIVITGPNGSGKSVLLKQTAIIVFLASIGCFVPCQFCELPQIDKIIPVFHNGGASEPFSSGFYDDLKMLSESIRKSTNRTLILVDEFGKTSNKDDGASLLAGFIRSMSDRGEMSPFVIISTHFRDILKENVIDNKLFIRMTMSVDCLLSKDELLFLYKAVLGEDEKSFGFECAKRGGYPPELVERAKIVCKSLKEGTDVPENPLIVDREMDMKMKRALKIFFDWNENSDPRALIATIESIFSDH